MWLQIAKFQFFMTEKYCIVCIYLIFFTHSSVDGYLDCFYILATVNNATMNIRVRGSSKIRVFPFLQIYTQSGNAGSYDSSIFRFFF